MINLLIRTFIIYVAVIVVIRLMGKRQQGQLQPFEIVITMIIADLAAMPMQDEKIPLLRGIIPLVVLLFSQVVFSYAEFKSKKFRTILNGKPIVLIAHGKINYQNLKKTMISFSDIVESMHSQGVSDLSEIDFAILEMNGKVSIFQKPQFQTVEKIDINADISADRFSYPVIINGVLLDDYINLTSLDKNTIMQNLKTNKKKLSGILYGYVDADGKLKMIDNDGEKL